MIWSIPYHFTAMIRSICYNFTAMIWSICYHFSRIRLLMILWPSIAIRERLSISGVGCHVFPPNLPITWLGTHSHTHAFTPTANVACPIHRTCMSLDCVGEAEHPEETHADTGEHQTPQRKISRGSNQDLLAVKRQRYWATVVYNSRIIKQLATQQTKIYFIIRTLKHFANVPIKLWKHYFGMFP